MSARKKYWLDRGENVTRLYRGLCVFAVLLVLLDFVVHRHEHFGFAAWFGFHAAYGFFACVALVLMAKVLRIVLKRPEDHYDR